jgi:hypothetical protein
MRSTSRTGRIESEVAENGGRKAAKSHRPRQEHKHTAQTGRTNPTRLGSSSRKSLATRAASRSRACTDWSPRARATKTSAANLASPLWAGSRSPTQSSSPGARKFKEQGSPPGVQDQLRPVQIRGCIGPRCHRGPPMRHRPPPNQPPAHAEDSTAAQGARGSLLHPFPPRSPPPQLRLAWPRWAP